MWRWRPPLAGCITVFTRERTEALRLSVRFTRRLLAVTPLGQQPDALCEVGREHGVDPLLGALLCSQNLAKTNKQKKTRKPA